MLVIMVHLAALAVCTAAIDIEFRAARRSYYTLGR